MKKFLVLALTAVLLLALAAGASAKVSKFDVLGADEEAYIVENTGSVEDTNGRYFDATTYIIYKFTTDPGDTYALFEMNITSGYKIEVSIDYDETAKTGTWNTIAEQELVDSNEDNWWSLIREKIDLSSFLAPTGSTTVYIKVGDYTTADGLGGYLPQLRYGKLSPDNYVKFTSAPAAPAELPVIEVPFAPGPDSVLAKTFTPIDISAYMADGYIYITYYSTITLGEEESLSDLLVNGFIELTSAGIWDAEEINYPVCRSGISTTEKTIAIKLSDFNPDSAASVFDPTAFDCIRIFTNGGDGPEIQISRIAISNSYEAPGAPVTPPPATDAPGTDPVAPPTSDIGFTVAAVALVAGCAAVLALKKKR